MERGDQVRGVLGKPWRRRKVGWWGEAGVCWVGKGDMLRVGLKMESRLVVICVGTRI